MDFLFVLQGEVLLQEGLEFIINVVIVVLVFEVFGDVSSAEWASCTVVELGSHALDTESMSAWQHTGFNEHIEAN